MGNSFYNPYMKGVDFGGGISDTATDISQKLEARKYEKMIQQLLAAMQGQDKMSMSPPPGAMGMGGGPTPPMGGPMASGMGGIGAGATGAGQMGLTPQQMQAIQAIISKMSGGGMGAMGGGMIR